MVFILLMFSVALGPINEMESFIISLEYNFLDCTHVLTHTLKSVYTHLHSQCPLRERPRLNECVCIDIRVSSASCLHWLPSHELGVVWGSATSVTVPLTAPPPAAADIRHHTGGAQRRRDGWMDGWMDGERDGYIEGYRCIHPNRQKDRLAEIQTIDR